MILSLWKALKVELYFHGRKILITYTAVTEMTCIRQEYGDVVCCIGSSLNAHNFSIFAQSDFRCILFINLFNVFIIKQLILSLLINKIFFFHQGQSLIFPIANLNLSFACRYNNKHDRIFKYLQIYIYYFYLICISTNIFIQRKEKLKLVN